MIRRAVYVTLAAAALVAGPASAQAPQFKADIRMSGGSLGSPAAGVMYFGGAKIRMELTADGRQMVLIQDPASGSMFMIMPSERIYLEMPPGMGPVPAPRVRSMDPANPCSGGQATDCRSVGDETVNGYATRKWQYEIDGESQTAWIATQFRFPVRVVTSDGTTTDYTNVTPGPQAAALFAPPSGFMKMEMGPITVMGMGAGAVPPGAGMPGMPPGFDPSMMGRGMSAADVAAMAPPGAGLGGTPWEEGDGWILEVTATVSGNANGTNALVGGTYQATWTGEYKVSVPLNYGVPGTFTGVSSTGPAWQLVPSLGSPRALGTPLTFSATTQYHTEGSNPAGCPVEDAARFKTDYRGTAQVSTTDHSNIMIMGAQVRWELSADLKTHHIVMAAGGPVTETIESSKTYLGACGGSPRTDTGQSTREVSGSVSIDLKDLPLPAAPGRMNGTATVPLRVQIGNFSDTTNARIQWTLRPM